jgi:osmoprotectant transport system ATP-binding protein
VLDASGELRGWVGRDRLAGARTVSDVVRRMEAWVGVDAPLKSALSTMLQHDAGWVAVLDGDAFLGVLTPSTLHTALRRSVEADGTSSPPETIDIDSVASV